MTAKQALAMGIDYASFGCHAAIEGLAGLEAVPLHGKNCQPNCYFVEGDGPDDPIHVGDAALNLKASDPERFIDQPKMYLGMRDADDKPIVVVRNVGERGTIVSLLAAMLRDIREQAERHAASPITRAVISHPDEAEEPVRVDLKAAALRAGFEDVHFVGEAAANLAYAMSVRPLPKGTLGCLVDCGNYTLNAILFEVGETTRIINKVSNENCGGGEYTSALVKSFQNELAKAGKKVNDTDADQLIDLYQEAERVKCGLSGEPKATFMPPFAVGFKCVITREQAEKLWAPLRKTALGVIAQLLEGAAVDKGKVNKLILAGGNNIVPSNRAAICHYFKLEDEQLPYPDMGVAFGAAIQARKLYQTKGVIAVGGKGKDKRVLPPAQDLRGLTSRDISIQLKNIATGNFYLETLIPKGMALPAHFSKLYDLDEATEDDGHSASIILRNPKAGETDPKNAPLLAKHEVLDLAASQQRQDRIRLDIEITEDEQITVNVIDTADQAAKAKFVVDRAVAL